MNERVGEAGEVCTCGRAAQVVFVTERWSEVGWCGQADGGRMGACAFCGDTAGHPGRCPSYTVRPAAPSGAARPGERVPEGSSDPRRRPRSLVETPAVEAQALPTPVPSPGLEGP